MSAKYPGTGGFADSSRTGLPYATPAGHEGDDLITAVHRLNRVARYGGIVAKEQAVTVLAGVVEGITAAAQVLAFELRHAGYGGVVTDPVYAGARSLE